jgi:hypothetical protein
MTFPHSGSSSRLIPELTQGQPNGDGNGFGSDY